MSDSTDSTASYDATVGEPIGFGDFWDGNTQENPMDIHESLLEKLLNKQQKKYNKSESNFDI
jgi:1-acyl-sn-glycerol-3-phosphate acyltransferase